MLPVSNEILKIAIMKENVFLFSWKSLFYLLKFRIPVFLVYENNTRDQLQESMENKSMCVE